jgi:hypothetical protein
VGQMDDVDDSLCVFTCALLVDPTINSAALLSTHFLLILGNASNTFIYLTNFLESDNQRRLYGPLWLN